jgi:hypothetical protein
MVQLLDLAITYEREHAQLSILQYTLSADDGDVCTASGVWH